MSSMRRIALVMAVCAAVLAPGLPAQADPPHPPTVNVPPTVGWSAEWHFDTLTDAPGVFGFSMTIPDASISGAGNDTDTSRGLTLALTDSSTSSLCAYL